MSTFFAPDRYETPDFTIRCYQPGDGQMSQDSVNTSYEHLRTFMPWAKPDFSLEELEANARRFCGEYLSNQEFALGIFLPDGTRKLGGTGFHLRGQPVENLNAEVGMWIRASEAGKGLGTRVLNHMLHWGFTAWPWVRLEWRCDTLNLASAAVARKAGMRLEGTLRQDERRSDGTRRDTYVFAILRDEYLQDTSP
ncbi:MAG: GNAT family N-acetyltransferase [Anaerolineae bacterium]|nr:GNAT family N-acetyltransferase [Anaerolineae bacterium]